MQTRRSPTAVLLVGLMAALAGACTYRARPVSGQQQCGPVGAKRCPEDYYCAEDSRCWKTGERPGDGGSVAEGGASDVLPPGVEVGVDALLPGDGNPRDLKVEPDLPPPVPAPPSRALAASAIISESATYRAVRTVGQAPGGNNVRSSTNYRSVGGLVGATQR
jgi:hypothetical protein